MLRPDEQHAKKLLEQYFRSNSMDVTLVEGNNPPDLVAKYNKKHIPLEVTRAENICIGKHGLVNRRTIDTSLVNLCNALNQEFGANIPSDRILSVYIQGPAKDGSRFKKSLKRFIRSIVTDKSRLDSLSHERLKTIVEDVPIELKLIIGTPRRKRIIGMIGNRDAPIDINREVTLVLNNRLLDKERKTQKIDGEKWLAILNNLVLSTTSNFVEAFPEINVIHSFTRIFLIGDGKVTEL